MPGAVGTKPLPRVSPLAGQPAPKAMLVDVAQLEREYFERPPDLSDPNQMVSFGTNGHRGPPQRGSFTEAHILAVTQAICDYRQAQRTDGPLYMGKDTHAVSDPAQRTALEVLAANHVETIIQRENGASFLRHDGTVWTTDKDGPIMNLLAAEITARTDKDPGEHYRELTAEFGTSYYTRIDAPATPEQKSKLGKLSPEAVKASALAGEPITSKLT